MNEDLERRNWADLLHPTYDPRFGVNSRQWGKWGIGCGSGGCAQAIRDRPLVRGQG